MTKAVVAIVSPSEIYAGALLAGPMGEFTKENLDVTYQRLALSDAFLLATQGKVQVVVAGVTAGLLNLIAQKDNFRQTGFSFELSPDSKEGLWVRNEYFNSDGSVNKAKVKGMQFNFGSGGYASSTVVPIARWLKASGFSINDVHPTELSGADTLAGLQQGSVGAGYLQSPFWLTAAQGNFARLVPGTGFSLASYIMETNFTNTQPEVAKAILRAMLRTQRTYLQGDYHANAAVLAALVTATGSTADAIKATPSLRWTTDLMPTTAIVQNIADAQDDWLQAGGILQYQQALPMERINDVSLAKDVVAGR
jgi:NitT/TauT family transport system substrate-binding protein